MRKSKEQVKRFLSAALLASEKDEHLIRVYLSRHKTKVPDTFGLTSDFDRQNGLTSGQFEAWFESDLPDLGDVIWCEERKAVGLVVKEGWDSSTIGAVLPPDGGLSLEEHICDGKWQRADREQILALQKALAAAGWDWNPTGSKLSGRVVPNAPRFVRLMEMGKQVGLGIFKGIMPDGTLEMFCVKMGGDSIRISSPLNLGDANAFSFFDTFTEHRVVIQEALSEQGYVWNSKCQRLQKNEARAAIGETYFWVTSYIGVAHSVEKNSPGDKIKFNRGNYFLTREAAERAKNRAYIALKEEMLGEG